MGRDLEQPGHVTVNAIVQVLFAAADELEAERLVESWQLHDGSQVTLNMATSRAGTADAAGTVNLELVEAEGPPGSPPTPPVAAFTFTPAAPVRNGDVTFDATASTNATGYAWDFGDGTNLPTDPAGSVAVHQYVGKGNYTVTLTVLGAGTTTDQASQALQVN